MNITQAYILSKSEMIEEILCEARERKRSLLGVNEHFVIRSIVQNLPTDDAEREQRVLAHFAEPQGGKRI